MSTFQSSPGKQFVRSPGKQRVATVALSGTLEIETIMCRKLNRAAALAIVYPASATPFSIIPPNPDNGFQYPARQYYNFTYNLTGIPDIIGTSPPGSSFSESSSLFGGEAFRRDEIFPDDILDSRGLGMGLTAYVSYHSGVTSGGTAPAEEWCGRRSRFRTSSRVTGWFARCELTDQSQTTGQLSHVQNVTFVSSFTTSPNVFVEVPFPMDSNPDAADNVPSFAILGETPAAWSARTGIAIS